MTTDIHHHDSRYARDIMMRARAGARGARRARVQRSKEARARARRALTRARGARRCLYARERVTTTMRGERAMPMMRVPAEREKSAARGAFAQCAARDARTDIIHGVLLLSAARAQRVIHITINHAINPLYPCHY